MLAIVLGAGSAVAAVGIACGSRTGLDGIGAEGDVAATGSQDAGVDALRVGIHQNLDCADAGTTYIYAIAQDNQIYSFYPAKTEFTLIGTLSCPELDPQASPFSMAVDHLGAAYVVFDDGNLFHVSTKTAECEPTPFVPGQHGIQTFGMGFVANKTTGETLYVSADDDAGQLATIDLDTFTLHVVALGGDVVDQAELTGTGDGRLYAFFAPDNTSPPSFIDEIDPRTAKVLSSALLPEVVEGSGWAFGFWGGDFYTFTAPDQVTTVVTRYRPSDGSVAQVASAPPGVMIVGAGVSTCAPQQ
jgi:hypothetical protein